MTTREIQTTLVAGDFIQWYRVERVLGRGGFGVTYLATDTNLDHKVAIKEYLPGGSVKRLSDNSLVPVTGLAIADYQLNRERFLREARTLVKFRHPNIVRVMAVFEANNTAYLVMEYEEGEQFKNYVDQNGDLAEDELKSLILGVIDGLDQVHSGGFIHRDIKPVNLIIRNDGTPVLIDFGSARSVNTRIDRAHTSFVSVGYTPLEQYQEGSGLSVGPWTDIYSLGATLYFAISGETPVSPLSRLAAHVKKSIDPLIPAIEVGEGRYSPEFLGAIDWALGFQIEERPQTLMQWRESLLPVGLIADTPGTWAERHAEISGLDEPEGLKVRNRRADRLETGPAGPAGRRVFSGTTVTIGMLVLAASLVIGALINRKQEENQRLVGLLQKADQAFAIDVAAAAPLYKQVLGEFPQNQSALSQIEVVKESLQESVEKSFARGDLQAARKAIQALDTIDSEQSSALKQRLSSLQLEERNDAGFARAEELLDAGDYNTALDVLATLSSNSADQERIVALEKRAENTRAEFEAQRTRLETERLKREQANAETRQRIADANERQRLRRKEYLNYLSYSERALLEQDIETARKWLENARSLQIDDNDFIQVEARVVALEALEKTPLSAYEISYSRGRFNSLKRAVETKNLRVISELTESSPSKERFFELLFDRYTRLKASVIEIEPHLEPRRVTAKLRLEELGLPNGDVVYPSPSYRDSEITIKRNRQSWSRIQW